MGDHDGVYVGTWEVGSRQGLCWYMRGLHGIMTRFMLGIRRLMLDQVIASVGTQKGLFRIMRWCMLEHERMYVASRFDFCWAL